MHYKFTNDYSDLVHPEIMKSLNLYLDEQNKGYGLDYHSENAKKLILEKFKINNGDVYFLTGGTQVNLVVISYLLKPYEGCIACDSGHINVHETGAIEGTGHKIFPVRNENGKIRPIDIERVCLVNNNEHMVKPKMVYISNSTETGSIYNYEELVEIRKVCDKFGLYLYMDGARIGVAFTSQYNNIKIEDIGKLCDVFYIGGTKNGFLSGEAVVFSDKNLSKDFRYHIKNKGAMLAKGYVLGIQFERAFQDNLYFDIAKLANASALYLKEELSKLVKVDESATNQLFFSLEKDKAQKVIDAFDCELWNFNDNVIKLRVVTSFKTKKSDCDELISFIKSLI